MFRESEGDFGTAVTFSPRPLQLRKENHDDQQQPCMPVASIKEERVDRTEVGVWRYVFI